MRIVRDKLERIKTLSWHITEGIEEIDNKSVLKSCVTHDQDSNPKSGAHKTGIIISGARLSMPAKCGVIYLV
jgi:hypothetical protein